MATIQPTCEVPAVSQADLDARFFQGLSDPTRVRILEHLVHGEKCVGEIVEELGIPQSSVSTHLGCLRWCGYVSSRKEGRNVYYQMTDGRVLEILRLARAMIADNAQAILSCQVLK
ncbi:MAG: metalloregulator ArsR/SmtB family transcription factor [Dehalococcoidales bacterium]|nr:metalloregulator ArsR/SmtB family transcription factor [Dehalococcoidales bacterium]